MRTTKALWVLLGSLLVLPAGCDDDGEEDRRSRLLAGCKEDKDCPKGLVCERSNCRQPSPEAAKPKAKPPAPSGPPPGTADLTVRLCPGYWGKSHNTGTVIAEHKGTGKKSYLSMTKLVSDGEFEDLFTFAARPYGTYEVKLYTGVIAMGKQDLLETPCAEKMECSRDKKTRIIVHGPPPPKEVWDAQLKRWAAEEYPGTDKEYVPLRRPCDFDVDRKI